ncbi:MAG: PEP-CTERM sorting domain-containing protein [Roseateles asaccharophilus]|uniref:Putative secreted protein with PEP-CTERM sorting signal/MYXO-CTERM domain-containing protein n=1 Tax=Roseateles asaccharophilus TaxID=582607 RepID=A0A4V3CJX9_9BURK|nr:PEP-CTERM sorting domain-containing protein [Roseateles asaccharophilus]MDN3545270.1 PEP-CTERM sorting domain-containing protein [Roseateles asaccharophilus]TDP11343.1 putative secreted protein with PEP-CTERM sorting signal/MYXO-CTERM domain-containing protein [Roseateles asaccharophilus]
MMTMRHTLLAAALAIAGLNAQAASFNLTGQLADGPLSGQTFTGSFSYDERALTGAGSELLDLSAWSISALGQTFTSGTVGDQPQAAFWDGVFVGLNGSFVSGSNGLTLADGVVDFANAYVGYRTPAGEGFGSYSISAVPEPSTWLMSLAGLLAVGAVARRRKAAV